MKKIIISADDFGLSKEVNDGVIKAYTDGVVTSSNIIVTKDSFKEAISFIEKNQNLVIGLSLDLMDFFDFDFLTKKIIGYKDKSVPVYSITKEIEKQVNIFLKSGCKSGHFSSYYFLHQLPELFPHVLKIMSSFGFKSFSYDRNFYKDNYSGIKIDWIEKYIYRFGFKIADMYYDSWSYNVLDELKDGINEIHIHPALINNGFESSDWRYAELKIITDEETKKYLKEQNIKLISFNDLIS